VFDVTLDFCKLIDGANDPFLSTFFSDGYKLLAPMFHRCPYTVHTLGKSFTLMFANCLSIFQDSLSITNLTIDGTSMPIFNQKPVSAKTEIIILNERSLKIFTLTFFGELVNENV
jgi:hypothetical protein